MKSLKEIMDFLKILFFAFCAAAIFCYLEYPDKSWSSNVSMAFSVAALITLVCWLLVWLRQWRVLNDESAANEQRLRDEVEVIKKYGH